jgi:hypothetical protein
MMQFCGGFRDVYWLICRANENAKVCTFAENFCVYSMVLAAEILKILLRDETLGPDIDPASIAKKTENFSGSDLKRSFYCAILSRGY